MEIPFSSSVATTVLLVAAITLTWRVLNWVWFRPKKLERWMRNQGLNGNSYRILFGDGKDFKRIIKQAQSKPINLDDDIVDRVSPYFNQTIKNYGKNSFLWLGPKPMINILNPEHIKEILTRINDFPKIQGNPLARILASGLASHRGEKWAKHRRIINPAFYLEKLKLMIPAFYESCSEMISNWEKLVCIEGSCELDVWPSLSKLSSDAISRTAFGSNYEEGKKIFKLLDELAILTTQIIQSIYIPGWRFVPTKINRRMKAIGKEIEVSLKDIIYKREKTMKVGELKNDLLGILMETNNREIQEHWNGDMDSNVGMSIEDVIDECKIFYFAGQETTSVLLVWTMILLSKHPNWQARAREEVLQVFGNSIPDFDGLNRLKVITMIFHEVLRLYPPVSGLGRSTNKEVKLGDLVVPAGIQFYIPIIQVHYDHEIWGKDGNEFNPERFSEGVSVATKNRGSFFPFGWGPRICIGMNFALLEAKMALALILQKFSFGLSPSYNHAPYTVITVKPQYGAQLIFQKL